MRTRVLETPNACNTVALDFNGVALHNLSRDMRARSQLLENSASLRKPPQRLLPILRFPKGCGQPSCSSPEPESYTWSMDRPDKS
jgi:hypothetical protein